MPVSKEQPIQFDQWIEDNREQAVAAWRRSLSRQGPRSIRRRPRDPEEAQVLTHLNKMRWQQALESGELEMLGPRRYRLRV